MTHHDSLPKNGFSFLSKALLKFKKKMCSRSSGKRGGIANATEFGSEITGLRPTNKYYKPRGF